MNFETITKNLQARGYKVACFETAAEAAAFLDGEIDGTTVGFGGSVTLEQLGLYELLATHNEVTWHQRMPEGVPVPEVRAKANAAELYVSSVNGIAETGEIVNIDGTGNRVAATFYGHKKVYLVAGANKIAPDYDAALHRARNIAAPLNAKRLHANTPCAAKGDRCYDCKGAGKICRGVSVFWAALMGAEYTVVLVNEELGY